MRERLEQERAAALRKLGDAVTVGTVNFGISEKIEPGKSIVWAGGRDYNQFIDEHRAVWNLEEGKYTTRFAPEMVVFEDGSKLAVPE